MKMRVLTINSKICLVAITMSAFSFLTVGAQTPITVTTDKPSYSDGDTIIISGTIADQLNIPISIIIKDSSQHIVYISQVNPNSDNTYSTQAISGGDLWKSMGTYEIDVTYGGKDKTSKTTFEFNPAGKQSSSSSNGNQTNTVPAIPEFGSLSIAIFAISTIAVVIAYARLTPSFKI